MARLGEQLVAARLLTQEQVDRALQAQILWGARLGTNLIELGLIDLDGLSEALGKQHQLPAACARHFEKADHELQRKLDPAHASVWEIVPLLRLANGKIAIASMDPLATKAVAQIAVALGCAADDLIVSLAAEQRMRYQLERVYGIARSARFLRAKGATITPFPELTDFEEEAPSLVEVEIEIPIDVQDAISAGQEVAAPAGAASELAALMNAAAADAQPAPTGEPTGRDRRNYIKTLADDNAAANALGRIAIKKMSSGPIPIVEDRKNTESFDAATRSIRRATNRDRVAELVMETMQRFAPMCQAAMIVIVRGEIAIGWKHFSREGEVAADIAVPMDQPGLVPVVVATNQTHRKPAGELRPIDQALLRALGREDGDLVVVPVPIGGSVMCMIATAVDGGEACAVVDTIATAASTAFGRLLRDASR
jgi:hypothetical protein